MTGGLRVGYWGARGDRRGLAIQGTELCRHLLPERVRGVDMGDLSPYPCDWSDYDPARLTVSRLADLDEGEAAGWLDGLDVVLGAETFYVPWLVPLARRLGVATALHFNREFVAHLADFGYPDLMLAPSPWRADEIPGAVYLPLGVDRERLPFRPRDRVATLLHVVGQPAARDRAGTRVVYEALRHVRSPLRLVVRAQRGIPPPTAARRVQVDIQIGDRAHYWDLYADGDLCVQPRRYGGQCLPAVEAMSTGMPVLMPDAEPQRQLLPPGMLVDCRPRGALRTSSGTFELHEANALALAARIDELAGDEAAYRRLCGEADLLAARLSWPSVLPAWRAALAEAVARRASAV